MSDFAYYSTFLFNALASIWMICKLRKEVENGYSTLGQASKQVVGLVMVIAALSGTGFFYATMWMLGLLGINSTLGGHGELLVAAVMNNLLLGVVLTAFGLISVNWKYIKW
jgi:hypothetical protein